VGRSSRTPPQRLLSGGRAPLLPRAPGERLRPRIFAGGRGRAPLAPGAYGCAYRHRCPQQPHCPKSPCATIAPSLVRSGRSTAWPVTDATPARLDPCPRAAVAVDSRCAGGRLRESPRPGTFTWTGVRPTVPRPCAPSKGARGRPKRAESDSRLLIALARSYGADGRNTEAFWTLEALERLGPLSRWPRGCGTGFWRSPGSVACAS